MPSAVERTRRGRYDPGTTKQRQFIHTRNKLQLSGARMSIGQVSTICPSLFLLSGCGVTQDFDACKYRGNSRTERACVIPYIYLMAHPEKFDGRDVAFSAWARTAGDVTLVFPTREAMEDGESVSSIVIYGNETASDLNQRNLDSRVVVKGKFYLAEGKVDPLDVERLGVLRNAEVLP